MKVGEMVEIGREPFVGEVGVVINVCLAACKEKDKFVVVTKDRMMTFPRKWLTKIK